MPWTDDPTHPFAGIVEKLKRANENICNLHSEIVAFFKAGQYPVMFDVNSKEWQEAPDSHRSRTIPKRFSVLSGEVIHQMRSCFDHIMWHFSSAEYRIRGENAIEFPVFRKEPIAKDEISRFERKVKGITNLKVISLIRNMQPYNGGSNAESDPICIVHDMDRFDKHRELAIVVSCAAVIVPANAGKEVALAMAKYSQGQTVSEAELTLVHQTIKKNSIVSPQIAFAKFGERKDQFVVPGLLQLHEAIFKRIDLFADLA
jgi:hypothetical protein